MLKHILIGVALFLTACVQQKSNGASEKEKGEIPSPTKSQQMDTSSFWKIMDYAFEKGHFNNRLREDAILEMLTKLTPEQIQQFEIIFQQMNQKASTWNNIAAHTIMTGGSSEDTYYYFRCWLISLGKHILKYQSPRR